jgi:sugar lactone lactonase YvrE
MRVCIALALSAGTVATASEPQIVAEWTQVQYDWSDADRDAAISSGEFIPEHNAMTGLKVCGLRNGCKDDRIFATVPRWATGVPATLNEIIRDASGAPLFRPWPNRESQDPHNCEAIQYVQSMEIDPQGVMWVLDVGRKYFAKPDHAVDLSCPPKMVLIDVNTEKVLSSYTFPVDVAPPDGSFLNDLAIDLIHQVAFISSTGNNASDLGAVVVYDRTNQRSRRFEDRTTHAATDTAHIRPLEIHGTDYTEQLSGFPTDGIALSPSLDRLYWSALGGYHLYSVSADVLRSFESSQQEVLDTLEEHGLKPDVSDGMSFGSNGDLFFGGLTTNSVYRWTPGTPLEEAAMVANGDSLWWVDTFAWGGQGDMWVTSNRLNLWFFGGMDFSGESGPNFRILKLDVGTNSYMDGEPSLTV